jgi:hypothetical protein
MFDEKEISEARSEDVNRGKKTARSLKRRNERLRRTLLSAFARKDRKLYSDTLNDLGQPCGSAGYDRAMKIFDDQQT